MYCYVCRLNGHTFDECNSEHAKTIGEAVPHWLSHKFIRLYSSSDYQNDILWLSKESNFTKLSKGDLLYLNREHYTDDPRLSNEIMIYDFIKHQLIMFYELNNENSIFSKRQLQQIQIDCKYWYMLTIPFKYNYEITVITRVQHMYQLDNPYENNTTIISYSINSDHTKYNSTVKTELTELECPVCLENNFKKIDCIELQCTHYLCKSCFNDIVQRDIYVNCPLCRIISKTITNFVS